MSALLDEVTTLLKDADLNYELISTEKQEVVNLGSMSSDPPLSIQIHVLDEAAQVSVYGIAECYLPEDKRTEACVLLNESNYIHPHKSYIDPNDGQLMAQKTLDVDGGALNKDVLMAAIGSVYAAIKRNYDVLMRLRYGS